jgi:hypothetical protein
MTNTTQITEQAGKLYTLERALGCIKAMRENRTLRDTLIGVVVKKFGGIGPGYQVGEYVVFRRYPIRSNVGRIQRYNLVVETPMSAKQIEEERKRGSLITTIGTIVGVPADYVQEVNAFGAVRAHRAETAPTAQEAA